MNQTDVFLSGKDITVEKIGEGVTRQILGHDNSIMFVKVVFRKGAVGDLHSHSHVQSSYIESGMFEVTIDGRKKLLVKGDGFFIPSGVVHGLICIEDGVVLDCFTPAREDFLQIK